MAVSLQDLSLEQLKELQAYQRQHQKSVPEVQVPVTQQPIQEMSSSKIASPERGWGDFAYDEIARPTARTVKAGVMGALSLGDLANMFTNPFLQIAGQEPFGSPSEKAGELIDYYTGGASIPQNETQRHVDSAAEFIASLMGGGGLLSKGAKTALPASKTTRALETIVPKTEAELARAGAFGAGAEWGNYMFPENSIIPLATGIAADIATGRGINAAKRGVDAAKRITYRDPKLGQVLGSSEPEAVSQSKRFGVRLSPGEATGKGYNLYQEDATLAGKFGAKNEREFRIWKQEQEREFKGAAKDLRDEIGGEPFIEKGAHAKEAVEHIQKTAKSEKNKIDQIYAEAREKGKVTAISPQEYDNFAAKAAKNLYEEGIQRSDAPVAYGRLKSLNNLFKEHPNHFDLNPKVTSTESSVIKQGKETTKTTSTSAPAKETSIDETRTITKEPGMSITDIEKNKYENPILNSTSLNQLEKWRETTNRAYREALDANKHNEGRALKSVLAQFDEHIADITEKALKHDPEALLKFKEGRKLFSQYIQKYSTNDPAAYGKKFIEKMIENAKPGREPYTPEMIVNEMFGAAKLGFSKQAASIAKEVEGHVPKELFKKVKLEAADRLLAPLTMENKNGLDAYVNNLNQLLKEHPTMMKQMFSGAELADLKQLGALGQKLFSRKKMLADPEGTSFIAEALKNLVPKKYGGDWVRNRANKIETNQEKIRKMASAPNQPEAANAFSTKSVVTAKVSAPVRNDKKQDNNEPSAVPMETEQKSSQPSLQDLSLEQLKEIREDRKGGGLLNKIAYAESDGDPNARNPDSSASGMYQFTNDTWKKVVKKYGSQTGITMADRNNPKAQRRMTEIMLDEAKPVLTKLLGRKPNETELYATHFLGLGDAQKLLGSRDYNQPAARLLPAAAKDNRAVFFDGRRPRSVVELLQELKLRLNRKSSSV